MNLITEYASRADVAIKLFKIPSSIVAITEEENKGKILLKPRVLTFSAVENSEHLIAKLYAIGSEEFPTLLEEQVLLVKSIFEPSALNAIFGNCRMVPYSFDNYPAGEIVYNDPPQSHTQESDVIKYFQIVHNSLNHKQYRRMLVWCAFITENGNEKFLSDYGQKINNGSTYAHQENVKKYDKKCWKKWETWCEKLCLIGKNDWANEILFAKSLKRMNKKDMSMMSIPICEDVETAA